MLWLQSCKFTSHSPSLLYIPRHHSQWAFFRRDILSHFHRSRCFSFPFPPFLLNWECFLKARLCAGVLTFVKPSHVIQTISLQSHYLNITYHMMFLTQDKSGTINKVDFPWYGFPIEPNRNFYPTQFLRFSVSSMKLWAPLWRQEINVFCISISSI